MQRVVSAAVAALAVLNGAVASGQAHRPDPAALKALTDLVSSYRARPGLGIESKVTIELTQDGVNANPNTVEGKFTFGPDGRAVVELRGFKVWVGGGRLSAVHEGRDDVYWTAPDDDAPYYVLLNAFSQVPFPELAIFLGEKEIGDLCMQIHQMSPWIQPTGTSPIERDGKKLAQVTMTSDFDHLVIEYDPKTNLIDTITLDVTGGDLVQEGAKLTYRHTYKYETFDGPPPPERLTFDPGQRKPVDALFGLMPEPPAHAEGGEDAAGGGLIGMPAPPIVLATIDGDAIDLAEMHGRVVVVDFWATWCGPCRAALPLLHEVAAWVKQQDLPATIFTVNVFEHGEPDQRLQKAKEFWAAKGFTLPVAMDYSDQVAAAYRVSGIPTTVVIRSDGVVHAVHGGLAGDYVEALKAEIQDALKALEVK